MITSNGKDPMRMSLKELKQERKVQSWLANQFKRMAKLHEYKYEQGIKELEENDPLHKYLTQYRHRELTLHEYKHKVLCLRNHMMAVDRCAMKAQLLRHYEEATRLFLLEIDDAMGYKKKRKKQRWAQHHDTPYRRDVIGYKYRKFTPHRSKQVEAKRKLLKQYETLMDRNGVVFQWDKKKLMQVAADRGYYSEIAVAYAIEECMELPKMTVKKMLAEGKFSWGQVLVMGALFDMTPKEFCDTFLRGYFIEQPGGEWRASFDNIDKNGLLAPTPMQRRKQEETFEDGEEVQADEVIEHILEDIDTKAE